MTSKRKNPHHGKPKARSGSAPERPADARRREPGRPDFNRGGAGNRGRKEERPRHAPGRPDARNPAGGNRPNRERPDARRDARPPAPARPAARFETDAVARGPRPRPERARSPFGQAPPVAFDKPPKAVPAAPRPPEDEPSLIEPELLEEAAQFTDDDDPDFMEEAPELGIGARVVPPNLRYEAESTTTTPLPSSPPPRDVEAQIRALEARLDGLIRRAAEAEAETEGDDGDDGQVEETRALSVAPAPFVATTTDSATRDYVAKRWGREALRNRAEEVDDFGLDPSFEHKVAPGLELLYRHYFRVQIEGMQNVPRSGRGVIVANHSGAVPLDGVMLRTAMRLDHPGVRDLRWLAEDFLFYLPFAGVFMNRIGAVRACQENAERMLSRDGLLAVFPEGVQGIRKLFRDRYQLQRFGRGGYIRLCLRMRAPLVPCAIIGAEETNPLFYRFDKLAELLKLPYLPVTPTFPWLGPLGLIPAPARWKIRFGEPLSFDSYGPEAADDDVLVGRLSERVRSAIQSLLDTGLRERKSVWFG
ncbi:MAG: lysophospholipid acyltransferase family protein [Polyangiaceae bacterium]